MKWLRKSWPYLLLAFILAVNGVVWLERQNIADWWRLHNYTPPSSISALASSDTMTPYARRLFYVNHPQLDSKTDFNQHCADENTDVAVLGCYRGNRQGIYLYAVTDSRLSGVRQVTAAHEMLHQAYDRLSTKDRKHIDQLLENYYQHGLTDQAVKTKLNSYKQQKGVDLVDEMHSIFGTEVSNLPPALENYYKQYFTDRTKVVAYRNSYQAEFTRRQTQVAAYDAQLTSLNTQITANKAILESHLSDLTSREKTINQEASGGDQTTYQNDVQTYNAIVATYNALLTTTRDEIDQYNQIVGKRNAIAVQEQQLQQALDSRLTTGTKQ